MQQLSFKRIATCVGIGILIVIGNNVYNNIFHKPKVSSEVMIQRVGSDLQSNIEKVTSDLPKASREATMKKINDYESKVKSGEIIRGKEERDKGLIAEQKEDLGEALHWYWAAGQAGYDKKTIDADKQRIADKRQAIKDEWKRICASQPPAAAKSFLEAMDETNPAVALSLYYDAANKGFDKEIVNKQIEKLRKIHRF